MKPIDMVLVVVVLFTIFYIFSHTEELSGKICLHVENSSGYFKVCFNSSEDAKDFIESLPIYTQKYYIDMNMSVLVE